MKRTRLDDNAYIIDFEDGEEVEATIAVLSGVYLTVVKLEHEHGVENVQKTLGEYRAMNPERFEIWRQQYEEALYTAIVELAKPLAKDVRRQIATLCNSTKIREAILAL